MEIWIWLSPAFYLIGMAVLMMGALLLGCYIADRLKERKR